MSDDPTQPDPRWSRQRIESTALHSVVGFLLGLIFTPMVVGGGLAFSRPFGPTAHLAAAVLGIAVIAYCTYGTCSRHPTAPRGVAIGLGAGAVLCLVLCIWWFSPRLRGPELFVFVGFLAQIGGQPWAAMAAGTRGLLKNLGQVRVGIGRTCATCGYDLSATAEGWRCPECGDTKRYERRPGEV